MSNSRLFCVAFMVAAAIVMLSEALGAPSPPSTWARLAINLHFGIFAIAFWGDRRRDHAPIVQREVG